MTPTPTEVDGLTEKIIACAIEVHRILGPGLLESVYRECMIIELRRRHLRAESERHVPLEYKGERVCGGLKLDLLIEDCVIVELKAVEHLLPIHQAQVITYLKLTGTRRDSSSPILLFALDLSKPPDLLSSCFLFRDLLFTLTQRGSTIRTGCDALP